MYVCGIVVGKADGEFKVVQRQILSCEIEKCCLHAKETKDLPNGKHFPVLLLIGGLTPALFRIFLVVLKLNWRKVAYTTLL